MDWLQTKEQTVPNICLRLQGKAFENHNFPQGGLLVHHAAVKYYFVKF